MRPPLRIAILECDTPLEGTRAKYGSYGGVFTALIQAAAEALDMPGEDVKISIWDVVGKMEYPKLEEIDAILITGSRHDAFDNQPWIVQLVDFVRKILAQDRVRAIGVCFGHQIVGRALNAKVGRNDRAWEVSVSEVQLSEKGKELFGKNKLNLYQMHKDIVFFYPKGVEELGSSPICEVQGMYAKGKLITIQGHPEFNAEIVTELLEARHKQGIFNDKIYDDAMNRVRKQHDGVLVAEGFLKFLLE